MRILKTQTEFMAIPLLVVILGVLFILFAASEAGLRAWLLVGAVGVAVCALPVWRVARTNRHPIQAADDGLREYPADQLVLVVHSAEGQRWLEQDAVDAGVRRG